MKKLAVAFFVGVLTVLSVRAHTVWIEPKDNVLVVRFAEPGNDFETSPGYLDSLTLPIAFVVAQDKPAPVEVHKEKDCFSLSKNSPTNAACVETVFTVRGGRKPYFYARWQPVGIVPAGPALNLDLLPTGKDGEVRAYFRGKPLASVDATLRGPDGKEQDLTSDAHGFLHFTATQAGKYLLTIPHYREPLAGFHLGVAYAETSHNAALTWEQAGK